METKGQLPPEYIPPQQPQQQPGFTPQQPQVITQQYVVNQPYPTYGNQGYVVQQGYPVQNQIMYTGGQPNVVVTQPTSTVVVNQRPSDYLACSLLTCLFCFFPTGIVALVFSCNSKQASDRNDFIKGRSDGNIAKIFSIISLCIGLLGVIALVIFLIVYFVVILPSLNSYNNNYDNYNYNNY
ncbi:hypothetical protein LOTGIDRAFT_237441 [Lottia gigantea]|uniref:Uncharacterized protein n=1 Tax=Lottia gigantea TaxID=225164 RepID=V4B1N0_LOTGI|nr:hypothetical protein LOTGIDRAFT_237441 [Lottia gigantea]ESP04253.1 hypothetical protein LOTGIDRAFT_237441 [Lottia gigantea]